MMTSCGQRGDGHRLRRIGFQGYLPKPVKREWLFDCLVTVLSDADTGSDNATGRWVTRHTINEARRRKPRLLVAEDNTVNRMVARGILTKLGCDVDLAVNGREAVSAAEKHPYDLILMDCLMPGMDGYAAARCIRRRENSGIRTGPAAVNSNAAAGFSAGPGHVPIIALTAYTRQSERKKCLNAGMDDYLSKPATPAALRQMLAKWLPTVPAAAGKPVREDRTTGGLPDTTAAPMQVPQPTAEPERSFLCPVFDYEALTDRLLDDDEIVCTIVQGFLADMPNQIAALKQYLDNAEISNAERQAHTIKGAAANVGGMVLSQVAYEMEKAGKAADPAAAAALMPALVDQFDTLKAAMRHSGFSEISVPETAADPSRGPWAAPLPAPVPGTDSANGDMARPHSRR